MNDDLILVQGCLEGRSSSQKQLYDRFAAKMFVVCIRYAPKRADAEDIMQEAFIRVYEHLAEFKGLGSLEGWVRRIVVHCAIRWIQKNAKHSQTSDIDQFVQGFSFQEPDAIGKISEAELLGLISKLPQGYKVVFNMFVVDGYSHKEIAEHLGIEESTSRSQLVKARKLLSYMLLKNNKIIENGSVSI
jgi:RNA polymerase sigma factor (sigma-70 family)